MDSKPSCNITNNKGTATAAAALLFVCNDKNTNKYSFRGCTQLVKIKFCKELEKIEKDEFACCPLLQHIVFPSTVKVIGEDAFQGCSNLMNVKLCKGLEMIEKDAFAHCTLFKRIIIPPLSK